MNKIYSIGQYISDISKQVRFCVTVHSFNNREHDRNRKNLKSVLQQHYENYHIVFVDDASTDGTLEDSMAYLKAQGFPDERVKYVRNLRRSHTTYSIVNAAFNFCGEDDVQLILDGKDVLLGRYVFQLMNAGYQKNKDLWIHYSSYIDSEYKTGLARAIGYYREYEYSMDTTKGKIRKLVNALGPLLTWRVKVLRHAPLHSYKMQNGEWTDTIEIETFAHTLL